MCQGTDDFKAALESAGKPATVEGLSAVVSVADLVKLLQVTITQLEKDVEHWKLHYTATFEARDVEANRAGPGTLFGAGVADGPVTPPMRELRVVFEKDAEGWWIVRVPAVPGCHTQGRTIEQGLRRIMEALELFDVDPKKVHLVRSYALPREALKAVERTAEARKRAEVEQQRAQSVLRDAAKRLAALGVSLRDAGELLGLSHQRVQQLLQSEA